MKHIIRYTLTLALLLGAVGLFAQTEDSTETKEILIDQGKVKIVIKEKIGDPNDTTHKQRKHIEIRMEEEREASMEEVEQMEEIDQLESEIENDVERSIEEAMAEVERAMSGMRKEEEEPKLVETDWFNFQLGINNLINADGELDMPAEYATMELDPLRSINFQVNVVQQAINLYKTNVRLVYGVAVDFNNYRFKNNIDLIPASEPLQVEMSSIEYKKNKLVAQYLAVPVRLDLSIGKGDDALHIAAGPNFQYLIGSHQKQKWNANGSHKIKQRDDYNLSTFRIGYEVQFGYDNFVLYGKYFPDNLFKAGQGPDMRTVAVGVLIGMI